MTQHRKSVPQTTKQPESTQAPDPTPDEWRRLLDAALRFQELAPWNWMAEADIFGVMDPETGDTGFVSVMGGIGEHFAMSLYLGEEALHDFLAIEYSELAAGHEQIMEIPQLMASFVERDDLENRDRKVLKRLGIMPQRERAWPQFQSYRPGFWPWFVDGAEARRLAVALEQAADVAPRCKDDETLLYPDSENQFLVRRQNESGQWVDEVKKVPPPPPNPFQLFVPGEYIQAMKALPGGASIIEMDLCMFPFRIGKKDERHSIPML